MDHLHDIIPQLSADEKQILATITNVEGSAYRKEGTTMLLKTDGSSVGMLSSGCLEGDLHYRIEDVHADGTQIVSYDMRGYEELSWGEGTGCNGVIEVLLEPVTEALAASMRSMHAFVNQGETVLRWATTAESGWFVCGREPDKQTEELAVQAAAMKRRSGRSSISDSRGEKIFVQTIRPRPRLFIFGAGSDARPLVQMAARCRYAVTVLDWRPDALETVNNEVPEAGRVLGFPHEWWTETAFRRGDMAVIMTHHFERDREVLTHLLQQPMAYIGVLGSKMRTKRLLQTEELPEIVTTPIGLSIGAEGPEEIAVSVVSQLIALQNAVKTGEVMA
ncbi:molybdenum cofactor sulfurylase [Marinococcus luteus]|uniref:Molybdenum cofactor sulfurylase n=1 Tax=Marinococcus luteus TaxID=1122204 RepID=A0A1H2TC63_9BACI|nr:XdhC family protein [Marinococcus luteus]SDW41482.1 molybdenum cofactor sulfurylase [Marinococcus luteus]